MQKLYTLLPHSVFIKMATMPHLTTKGADGKRRPINSDSAREILERGRWAGEPACPKCNAAKPIYKRHLLGYFRCPKCKLDFTVRTGTVMARSHVALDKWVYAAYIWMHDFHQAPRTIGRFSSARLSRQIEVTQKTAWLLQQRLQEALHDHESRFLLEVGEYLYRRAYAKKQQGGSP